MVRDACQTTAAGPHSPIVTANQAGVKCLLRRGVMDMRLDQKKHACLITFSNVLLCDELPPRPLAVMRVQ